VLAIPSDKRDCIARIQQPHGAFHLHERQRKARRNRRKIDGCGKAHAEEPSELLLRQRTSGFNLRYVCPKAETQSMRCASVAKCSRTAASKANMVVTRNTNRAKRLHQKQFMLAIELLSSGWSSYAILLTTCSIGGPHSPHCAVFWTHNALSDAR